MTIIAANYAGMPGVTRYATGLRDGREVLALANALLSQSGVKSSTPSLYGVGRHNAAYSIPNDPRFRWQWHLWNRRQRPPGEQRGIRNIDIRAIWAGPHTTGSPDVRVVVLDDGVESDHLDLLLGPGFDGTGYPAPTPGDPLFPSEIHGTAMAGPHAQTKEEVGLGP